MTEKQFDEYLKNRIQQIKNETNVSVECQVTGDLECYARDGSFREYGTYGFDSEDDLEDALVRIEDVVDSTDVEVYHKYSDYVSIEGRYKDVMKVLSDLSSSIVNSTEIDFEEIDIYT